MIIPTQYSEWSGSGLGIGTQQRRSPERWRRERAKKKVAMGSDWDMSMERWKISVKGVMMEGRGR